MKQFVFAALVIVISVLVTNNAAFAQNTFQSFIFSVVAEEPQQQGGDTDTQVHERALRDFRENFGSVEDPQWYTLKDGFLAEFKADEIRYRVFYNSRGNRTVTEKDYTEDKLEASVRAVVKSVYFDHQIFWVREIAVADGVEGPVYFVHIEDKKGFKNLIVYNGEMSVLEEYAKG